MAYIGAEPVPGQNREVDDISSGFNGNATAFTLQVSSVNVSPESANNILINLGGVLQNPGTDYTIAASTITFTTAPAAGLSFFGLILGAGINTATVADQTIGTSKVLDNAITADKLAHTSVTAGSYTTADITVDAQGRITAAASGTISGAEIADQAVTNAKVNNSAAIAGTKISPDFGSQNVITTGTFGSANITVTGTQPKVFLTDNNNNPDYSLHNANGTFNINDETNSASRFAIDTNGLTTIAGALTVGGDFTIPDTIVHTGDTNTKIRFPAADTFSVETAGAEVMRITSTARVGIGTNNPLYPLHVKGLVNDSSPSDFGVLMGLSSNDDYAQIQLNGDTGAFIDFSTSGTDQKGRILYIHSSEKFEFFVNSGKRAQLTGDGLILNGTDTAAANALDSYEEGTWTPTPTAGSFTSATGRYTKIGRIVVATYVVQVNTNQGASFFQFNGLPFDNVSSSPGENLSSFGFTDSGLNGNIVGTVHVGTGLIFTNFSGTNYRYNTSGVSGKIFRGGVTYMSSV